MDFGFTDDQRALRDVLRQFVDKEIVPVARGVGADRPLPDRDRRRHEGAWACSA